MKKNWCLVLVLWGDKYAAAHINAIVENVFRHSANCAKAILMTDRQREGFLGVGALDPEQSIDEDTDLCMRLLARSCWPWHEPEPGMRVYRGYAPARSAGAQLTVATPIGKGLQCYRRTYDKNAASFGLYSAMRWFLATRYLKRAVKAGAVSAAL